MKEKYKAIIAALILVILAASVSFVSYVKFATPNFLSAAAGLIKVCATDVEYAEIKKDSRVIVAKPDNAMYLFKATLISEGYEFIDEERDGSIIAVQKDGEKEHIHFSVNEYYSLWEWL